MKSIVKANDHVFSLSCKKQSVVYFDDTSFVGRTFSKDVLNDVGVGVFRLSENEKNAFEFFKFVNRMDCIDGALLQIECNLSICDILPFFPIPADLLKNGRAKPCQPDVNPLMFFTSKNINSLSMVEEVDDFGNKNMFIVIDLKFSSNIIIRELYCLARKIKGFSLVDLFKDVGIPFINIKTLKTYFFSERLFSLVNDNIAFCLIEYCELRKKMRMSERSAHLCIEKIYGISFGSPQSF